MRTRSGFDARAFVFAILALTVARMGPVAISMIGSGLRPDTVLVMGWLGPRGLASVVFTLIAVEALHESAQVDDRDGEQQEQPPGGFGPVVAKPDRTTRRDAGRPPGRDPSTVDRPERAG